MESATGFITFARAHHKRGGGQTEAPVHESMPVIITGSQLTYSPRGAKVQLTLTMD